jgi:hypothetical protein
MTAASGKIDSGGTVTDRRVLRFAALALVATAACATSGTRLHEMSEAEHERTAGAEEAAAARSTAAYQAALRTATERCRTRTWACWRYLSEPAEGYRQQAERHLDAAARHRAAARALAQAEARACAGVPDLDRDMSPFAHRADIESVAPMFALKVEGTVATQILQGAQIAFRPVPGLTPERLQRIVSCHLERNAALGHDVPEMDYCPLVPRDVSATVLRSHRARRVQGARLRGCDRDHRIVMSS